MNPTYLLLESFVKFLHPYLIEEAEALAKETIKPQIGPLLTTALDEHVRNLTLHKDYVIITSPFLSPRSSYLHAFY